MDFQQVAEFTTNHPLLSGGFVAVLLFWLFTEVKRKMQGFQELTPAQAVRMMNHDDTVIVDLSSQADYNKGHIADAIHMSQSQLAGGDAQLGSFKGKRVLVVDKAGQAAGQAAQRILNAGAGEVAVLKGGMSQWINDQYPVTRK